MNRLLALVILLYSFSRISAQEPFFFQHEIGDPNSAMMINSMIQDHQSMMWIGTDQGLVRFDGINSYPVVFDAPEVVHKVTALFEDRQHRLWIGTSSGEIFYLDRTRKPIRFDAEEGHPVKSITAILEDKFGQIWFATYGEGVYVYTGKRVFNFGEDDGLSGNDIYAMTYTKSGEIWLGTDDGINICTFENEKKFIKSLGLADGLPDQIITALKADENGNIWIGTFEYGVVYYQSSLQKIISPFLSEGMDEITSFEIFDNTELWIGTRKNGAWRYNPQTGFVQKVMSLQSTRQGEISKILTDVEGNIWIALREGFLLSGFRPFESVAVDIGEIQTLFADHRDMIWIGTKIGLYLMKQEPAAIASVIRIAPQYDWNITSIVEDRYHNLWIGTLDKGLFIYNPFTQSILNVGKNVPIISSTIMSMASGKGVIWISTLEGVVSYPLETNILLDKNIRFPLVDNAWQSSLHFVFQVFVDSKDKAWFATSGNGVYCIQGDSVRQFSGTDSIPLRTVYSICEDHRGHMWFNTSDQGLVEFDGLNYSLLGFNEGLGNMSVASMAMVGTGDLLLAHKRGLELMEPDRRHFMYYDEEIGINDFDAAFNSITSDSKGHVYVTGKNKLIKYYATGHELSIHPRTQLTDVFVYEQPIDITTVNSFPHNKNYFTFDYVGLWYTSPHSVKYLYKLEGYDLQWKESKDNVASYSSLPPGTYTFSVKASENKFFLDEPIDSYSFTIVRPFWQMPWFVAFLIILTGGLLYLIIKAREQRSERQANVRKDMIESQLQTLKAQINPHFLFNSFNTLITIIDENVRSPDVAITYVEKLSDYFRSILQYREQETISMEEEWELVQNFGYLLEKRYGTNLRLHMSAPPKDACILPLTLQMLLENAVKHNVISSQKPLDVFISSENGYIKVENNLQLKAKQELSTRFGLQSIIKRYQLMSDKKIIIEQSEQTFKVLIPIINK
ncbi:MAG: histidine kinase [Bacteroidota bacterium]|nr:histidine kinase [Bacteroidota bacterium]